MPPLDPHFFTFRRTTYRVERIEGPSTTTLHIHYILHGPRRRYALIPHPRRPDLLFAVAPRGLFSFRRTPFAGVYFKVEEGKLVIAAPDA